MSTPLIEALLRAVAASPQELPLRQHLAQLLLDEGDVAAAVSQLAIALQQAPADPTTQQLMSRALGSPAPTAEEPEAQKPEPVAFDWSAAEEQLGDQIPEMFVGEPVDADAAAAFDLERPRLKLADVGGMEQAKLRLEASFLAPLRNPELRKMYRKSLRGGLLMYGPPGCGKTYLARALAGELDAGFISVTVTDILDQMIGNSERNVHELFLAARRAAPCVVFFDEVDALGVMSRDVVHG